MRLKTRHNTVNRIIFSSQSSQKIIPCLIFCTGMIYISSHTDDGSQQVKIGGSEIGEKYRRIRWYNVTVSVGASVDIPFVLREFRVLM